MSRLIDADKLLEELREYHPLSLSYGILSDIEYFPTAGMKDGLYTRHEVACIIADLFGNCACDYSGNDEWLPQYCEFADKVCPDTVGVACWEQYLKHMDRKAGEQNDT